MSHTKIKTIYLLPHSHTDIGYTHDPLITWELHDRFLDQAIHACEQTFEAGAEVEPFRWTIEVFATLEHWLERRSESDRDRLRACIARQQIDFGARRFHGTFLYTPADIRWEQNRFLELCRQLDVPAPGRAAVQHDVNGLPLAWAEALSAAGVGTLLMGLNTTLGASPLPRPGVFRWVLPSGRALLVHNGWIYNRIRRFTRLGELGTTLPGKLNEFLEHLPADYPLDFLITSATANDNVGPFEALSEQVALFNRASTGVTMRLATAGQVARLLAGQAHLLKERRGDWMDPWSVGAGAMPQVVAAARRAQRKLDSVQAIRDRGWASVTGGSLTMDRARDALSVFCEHTCSSHSASGMAGSADVLRQQAQCDIHGWNAESVATALLRDHLAAMDQDSATTRPAVMLINPTPHRVGVRATFDPWGYRQFSSGQRFEHLLQFDREPTRVAFEASAALYADAVIEPGHMRFMPMTDTHKGRQTTVELPLHEQVELAAERLTAVVSPNRGALVALRAARNDWNWIRTDTEWLTGVPVLERPTQPSFMDLKRPGARDPSDEPWADPLTFDRAVLGQTAVARNIRDHRGQAVCIERSGAPVRRISYRLDPLIPDALIIDADVWFDDDRSRRAIYLPFALSLPGDGPVTYRYDSCGTWLAADEQIAGAGTSHYEAYRGVAVSRNGATVYLIARDTPLWQLGSFNFGQPWCGIKQDPSSPFVAAWLYNNYWHVNFPAMSPGQFASRFLLCPTLGEFDATIADRLYAAFAAEDWHHPLDPNHGFRAD